MSILVGNLGHYQGLSGFKKLVLSDRERVVGLYRTRRVLPTSSWQEPWAPIS